MGENYMEQNIGILFVVIGSLSASIDDIRKKLYVLNRSFCR